MFRRWSMALLSCAFLSYALAAHAATAIRLETEGDLPFDAEELEQAAGARLAMSAEAGAALVIVGPADEAGVQVRIGDRQGVVPVGARVGLDAARVVALAIAELLDDEAGGPSAEAASAPSPGDGANPDGPSSIAVPVAVAPAGAPVSPSPTARLAVAIGTAKGTDTAEPFTWTGEADAAFPLRGFDAVAGLGVWDVPTRNAGRLDEVSFVAGVVRAGVGWQAGPLQLVLGPFVAPYRLEGGAVRHTGVLAGGGALVRVGWALGASKVRLFGSFRVDAFADRVRVSASVPDAEPSFASPRLAASLALGIGWDLGI